MKHLRFDLAHATVEQIELLTPLATARFVTFHHELTPLAMERDPDNLTLVVANLLTNAIHYNREGGEVRVTLQRQDDAELLPVAHTGEGMAPATLARIFDRFYRADQFHSLPACRNCLGFPPHLQSWSHLHSHQRFHHQLNGGTSLMRPKPFRLVTGRLHWLQK